MYNANPTADAGHHADEPTRRDFIHIAAATAAAGGVVATVWPLVDQMNPSGDTLALASTEFDIAKVALGQQAVVKWRGKPVFVRHRTPAEIAAARKDDGAPMRNPAKDEDRVKKGKDEWLILVGVCTHLGCVPNFGSGEYGGWLCPCHGSVYDTSGRIRQGPAPRNLDLPEYAFLTDTRIKIG
ncbi:MAG TPA: ubiquinol-cytochrome c reductase iron-sulfur subunit [Caulobacteraceae bacterium]|nr:ubiquinol-cytochrome c reductase iron-sulfur subunit [Caulobacteraceae bacterium]